MMTINNCITIEQSEKLLEESTQWMNEAYFSYSKQDDLRNTLFNFSWIDRSLNNLIAYNIRRIGRKSGITLDQILNGENMEGLGNNGFSKLIDNYETDYSPIAIIAKIAIKIQRARYPIANRGYDILEFKDKLFDYMKEFSSDMFEYQQKYGKELFSDSAINRAGSNVIAMRLFAESNGLPCPPKKAMYAIALLHPLTDDYMDREVVDKKIVAGITRTVEGERVITDNPYETVVYDLIDDIYASYPTDIHPLMKHILRSIHQMQIMSLKQKKENISIEEVADTSFRKGGLSTLCAAYIALGGLTENQYKFFYEGGAIFQLVDDLRDIEEDLRDGVTTVWTHSIRQGKTLDEPFHRTLQIQSTFQPKSNVYTQEFAHPYFVNTLHKFGFSFLSFLGFVQSNENFGKEIVDNVKAAVPIRYNELKDVTLALKPNISGELFSAYMK